MPNDLSDDELLNVPLANLQPGELRRVFQVMAVEAEKKQVDEIVRQSTISALQRSHEEETNHEREEMHRREADLLVGIQERERDLMRQSEQMDARTIKLDDGRQVYVDRDKYRDGEGRELSGADRAQAEQHHLEQPDATTWEQKQALDRQLQAAEQLRQKVEKLQARDGQADASKMLSGYEKEFQQQAVQQSKTQDTPDYGSGDYMAAFTGLTGGFTRVASPQEAGKPQSLAVATLSPQSTVKSVGLTL